MPSVGTIGSQTYPISAAAWATSGAASAGSTGLNSFPTGSWTHYPFSASDPAPPASYSSAVGYIALAAGAAGSIKLLRNLASGDPTFGSPPSGSNTDLWMRFWFKGQWDGTTAHGAVTTTTNPQHNFNGSNYARPNWYVNSSSNAYNALGFAFISQNGFSGAATNIFKTGSSTGIVHGGWNQWHRLTIHFKSDASAGGIEIYLNGVLINSSIGNSSGNVTNAGGNESTFTFPQVPGVTWKVTGPIEVWNDTDITEQPLWELDNTSSAMVTRIYQPWNAKTAAGQGHYFTTATTSGTGTITGTGTEYAASGGSPTRRRMVWAEASGTFVGTATTIDEIGTLPFNDQGWASVVLSDCITAHASNKMKMTLYKAGGTSELISLEHTGTTLNAYYDGGAAMQVATVNVTSRFCWVLHLHLDGRARVTIFDLTGTTTGAEKLAASHPLIDWVPQAIGKICLTGTVIASNNVETGYVAICRMPSFACVDSLSQAFYTPGSGQTANISSGVLVARSFPYGEESSNIPGAYWPRQENGMGRRLIVTAIGRTGKTRRDWWNSIGMQLAHTHGVEFVCVDGGSINDIAEITSNSATPVLTRMKYSLEQFLKNAVANDNAVWITTMIPRGRSVTITSSTNANPVVLTATAHGIVGATIARCFITGVTGAGVGGMDTGTLYVGTHTLTNANTITLANIAGGGPNVSTTGTGGTMTGYSTQEVAAITTFNTYIISLAAQYQTKGLITVSDIAADVTNNASMYPNTGGTNTGFWQDFTHPNADLYNHTDVYSGLNTPSYSTVTGANTYSKRMLALRSQPSTPARSRRLSTSLVGR